MKQYPLIFIPNDIIVLSKESFYKPIEPIKPTPKNEPIWQILLLIPFAFIIGIFIPLVGGIFFILIIYNLFNRDNSNDLYLTNSYISKLKIYQDEIIIYENAQNIEEYIQIMRRKKLNQILSNSKQFSLYEDYKKGRSHEFFKYFLEKEFGSKIREGVAIINDAYFEPNSRPYISDFGYINNNIKFLIEIDEPYTLDNKEPIHLFNSESENKRNNFFLNSGWIILRFAEEQIVNDPFGCCEFIKKLINSLEDNLLEIEKIKSPLLKVNVWDLNIVRRLITEYYRETYLNKLNNPQYIKATEEMEIFKSIFR